MVVAILLFLLPVRVFGFVEFDSPEDKSTKFKWPQLIAPAALITVGSLGVSTNFGIGIRETFRDVVEENRGPYRLPVDDVIQFVPLAMDLGLGFTGVKARHNFRDRAMVTFTAYATMAVLVNTLKYTVREPRPGSGVRNSFPSGHTAVAFTAAEIVRVEYGPWWGLAAYSVAGATAFLRVWNNWHWTSDVIAGAGIGILSANAAYWLLPLERKLFRMDSKLAGAAHYKWQALPFAASTPVGASYGLTLAVQW